MSVEGQDTGRVPGLRGGPAWWSRPVCRPRGRLCENLSQTSLLSSELPSGTGVRRPSLQCPPGQLPSQGSPLPRVEHGGTFCRCPAFASPELWLLCDLLSRPGGPPPAKSLAAFNPAVLNGFIPLRLTHPSLPFLVQFQPNPDRRLAHTSERLRAHGGPRFRIMIPVTASHRICNLRHSPEGRGLTSPLSQVQPEAGRREVTCWARPGSDRGGI